MGKPADGASDDSDNVSERLPATDIEAAAISRSIGDLLNLIPATWAEYDFDNLSNVQTNALFLLTAAGMVERRGWLRTTIANHPTCFENRFQATGEYGFAKVLEKATAIEYESWNEAWRKWSSGETKHRSPFHMQTIKPQEWRLTDQGETARDDISGKNPDGDPRTVIDYVLRKGFYGPGYWMRRMMDGRPLSPDEEMTIKKHATAGHDITHLPRPSVAGDGQLLEIRKVEQTTASQAVNLTNWGEGATTFAEAFAKQLGPMFEVMQKQLLAKDAASQGKDSGPIVPASGSNDHSQPSAPAVFTTGVMVFHPEKVMFCGVDICSGPRAHSRRVILELLAKKRIDGTFVTYSGEELERKALEKGTKGTAARWIQDLRVDIVDLLRSQGNIVSEDRDVILNGGPGYRFSERVSVQFVDQQPITDITDTSDVPNVPNQEVRNVPNREEVPDPRVTWILDQLKAGVKLKGTDVMEQFECVSKTAYRLLGQLQEDGKIEFVGSTRTGYYQMVQDVPPES